MFRSDGVETRSYFIKNIFFCFYNKIVVMACENK